MAAVRDFSLPSPYPNTTERLNISIIRSNPPLESPVYDRFRHDLQLFILCVNQNGWFRDMSGNLLDMLIDRIWTGIKSLEHHPHHLTNTLFNAIHSLTRFFEHPMLLQDHINQLDVVALIMVSIIPYVYNTYLSSIGLHCRMQFSCQCTPQAHQ